MEPDTSISRGEVNRGELELVEVAVAVAVAVASRKLLVANILY